MQGLSDEPNLPLHYKDIDTTKSVYQKYDRHTDLHTEHAAKKFTKDMKRRVNTILCILTNRQFIRVATADNAQRLQTNNCHNGIT